MQADFGAQAVELLLRKTGLLHFQLRKGFVQGGFHGQLLFQADVAFAVELHARGLFRVQPGRQVKQAVVLGFLKAFFGVGEAFSRAFEAQL